MTSRRLRTLVDLIEERATITPERAAFFWEDQPYALGPLWQSVNAFASLLIARGVKSGDRVLIRLPNGPEFYQAFYGVLRAGGIAVPLFPSSGSERIVALASMCGATVVVVPSATREEISGLQTVAVTDQAPADMSIAFPEVAPDAIAFLQYTSGSTGSPKGVMLSHEGLLTNIGQLIGGMQLTSSDCFVSWLPVFHDMGLILMTMVPLYLGAKLVLLPTSLANPRPWLSAITKHRGTVTAAPDFAYRVVLRHVRDPAIYDLSSLRVALNAAEPVRLSTIEAFERAFGLRNVVIAGYGLAEATVGVATWTPGAPPLVDARGVVSVGRPFSGIEIRIIEGDAPLPPGRVGEIVVRSPANTRGYFSDTSETAGLFWHGEFIRTGDLGYLDEEGRLFVTSRLKNIIKHAGSTVFPQEPEAIADRLGFIRRTAAVGVDSGGPEGEQLYVFAELSRPGAYGEPEFHTATMDIVQAIHGQLGIRPGRVYLLKPQAIPITPNGKTQHTALRAAYLSGDLRARNAILFPAY